VIVERGINYKDPFYRISNEPFPSCKDTELVN